MTQDNILLKGVQDAYNFISRVDSKYCRFDILNSRIETKFKLLQGFTGLFFREFNLGSQGNYERYKIVQSISPYTGNIKAQKVYRIMRDYAKRTAQEIIKEAPCIKGDACLETMVCTELLHKIMVLYDRERIGFANKRYHNGRVEKKSSEENELISIKQII